MAAPGSRLTDRLGLAAVELAIIGALWYFGFISDVIAAGLAAVFFFSALVPERWGTLVSGAALLVFASVLAILYPLPGDRRLGLAKAIIGVILLAAGALRMRAGRRAS